jgi:NADH-quinone oxidoreductase subunit M
MGSHILSLMIFVPLLGAIAVLCVPSREEKILKTVAACAAAVPLALAVLLYCAFDRSATGMQFVERVPWLPSFNIEYYLGIDGLSGPMVLLTALLTFICTIASWNIEKGLKGYMSLFLLLETGMMGTFCALDFFLFYVFWEVMLLPMYFLIGIWGGPRREYAAIKFFLYTLAGSVLLFLGMIALYFYSTPHTFDIVRLAEIGKTFPHDWTPTFSWLVFLAFFVAFAIKVPAFPFHTWLPDAHVEAPTAVSVILAGVLLKMGTYGILRFNYPIFPEATKAFAIPLAIIALINIVYGAFVAMAQRDLKKLVAYSSISHMGFVMLGMAAAATASNLGGPAAINGAVLQMFNHGCITAMLFLLVGVIYDRAHHRDIDGFGGLAQQMPVYTAFVMLAFFAALGLPGLSSFISEALVFIGSFTAYPAITIAATTAIVIGAAYMLWTLQRVFLGPLNKKYADLPDASPREIFCLAPLGIIVIILGVYPAPVLDMMNPTLTHLLTLFR